MSAQLYRKPVVLKFSPRVLTKTLILYSVHQLKYQISLTLKLEGGRLIWYTYLCLTVTLLCLQLFPVGHTFCQVVMLSCWHTKLRISGRFALGAFCPTPSHPLAVISTQASSGLSQPKNHNCLKSYIFIFVYVRMYSRVHQIWFFFE